jgi:FKBP-type peptidyl-prolyl cis-trans isomerase FkpA
LEQSPNMKRLRDRCLLSVKILLAAVLLHSCASGTDAEGYSEASPGVKYKLHFPGESGKKAGEEDFLEVRMQNKYAGKVFFDSEFENARGTLFVQSSTSPYFSVLAEGDSATFVLPGGDLHLPGMPDTGMVEMNVKVLRIISADELDKLERSTDPDTDEQILISRYLKRVSSPSQPDSAGVFLISETTGNGLEPQMGDTVRIQYRGALFNGQVFDDSYQRAAPFEFVLGDEGQILPGIHHILWKMKPGGKAKIILPSRLAFGPEGSSTGIVPPHTPVVYEVELVSVY